MDSSSTICVVAVEPLCKPEVREISDTLEAMQALVGGTIQVIYPFEDTVALVANDEGKLLRLQPNRALRDDDGIVYDIICGTFFLCGAPADSENFASLTEAQVRRCMEAFAVPEMFFKIGEKLIILPCL